MIDKVLWAIIPACITFGPLFMTRIVGTAQGGDRVVGAGVILLSVGLVGMFRIIYKQQRSVRALEKRLGKEE